MKNGSSVGRVLFSAIVLLGAGCAALSPEEEAQSSAKTYSRVLVHWAGAGDRSKRLEMETDIAGIVEKKFRIYAVPEARLFEQPFALTQQMLDDLVRSNSLEAILTIKETDGASGRFRFDLTEPGAAAPAWSGDAAMAKESDRPEAIGTLLAAKLKTPVRETSSWSHGDPYWGGDRFGR